MPKRDAASKADARVLRSDPRRRALRNGDARLRRRPGGGWERRPTRCSGVRSAPQFEFGLEATRRQALRGADRAD